MTKYLKKHDFQQAAIRNNVEVEIPELGGTVFIKHITVHQRNTLLASLVEYDSSGKAKASPAKMGEVTLELIAISVVDEESKPIFTIDDLKGFPATMSNVIELLFSEVNKVNPITITEERKAEKN